VLGGKRESVLETSWRFTYPWNLLGLPAISLPCGVDRLGLPIGIQIAGAAFDEAAVIRTAALVEKHQAAWLTDPNGCSFPRRDRAHLNCLTLSERTASTSDRPYERWRPRKSWKFAALTGCKTVAIAVAYFAPPHGVRPWGWTVVNDGANRRTAA